MILSLAEELLLIALKDEKGTVVNASALGLPFGLAGATLMELSQCGRVRIENKRLIIADPKPTGQPLWDECLQKIGEKEKPKSVRYWISRFGSRKTLHNGYLDLLVQKNILKRESKRILWVFSSTRYPMTDSRPETEERNRLRRLVLDEAPGNSQTYMLLSLVRACDLVGEVFSKAEKKEAKKRIEALVKSEAFGKAVSDEIAGVITACIVASMAASVAASSH